MRTFLVTNSVKNVCVSEFHEDKYYLLTWENSFEDYTAHVNKILDEAFLRFGANEDYKNIRTPLYTECREFLIENHVWVENWKIGTRKEEPDYAFKDYSVLQEFYSDLPKGFISINSSF